MFFNLPSFKDNSSIILASARDEGPSIAGPTREAGGYPRRRTAHRVHPWHAQQPHSRMIRRYALLACSPCTGSWMTVLTPTSQLGPTGGANGHPHRLTAQKPAAEPIHRMNISTVESDDTQHLLTAQSHPCSPVRIHRADTSPLWLWSSHHRLVETVLASAAGVQHVP